MEDCISTENCVPLPIPCLRLLVPPLRLVSAAIWQTLQQHAVADYGMLAEFVSMVTDAVPELLTRGQRAQLILGLRARLILELCQFDATADLETIQPHLERMQTLTALWEMEGGARNAEVPKSDFAGLVENLLKTPEEKEKFFQHVFPKEFGPMYDETLNTLMWLFLSRLEKFLPLQTFQQVASMLGDVPSPLEECMESVSHCQELKTLLQYQKDLIQLDHNDCYIDGACITSALKLPSVERNVAGDEKAPPDALQDVLPFPISHFRTERESALQTEVKLENAEVMLSKSKAKEKPNVTTGKVGETVLSDGDVTGDEDNDDVDIQVQDEPSPHKECRILLKRLDASAAPLPSRPVRKNRGQKMKRILLQEKRRRHKEQRPASKTAPKTASKTASTVQVAAAKPSVSEAPSSGVPPDTSDEDSVDSDKDPSYVAPDNNSSDVDYLPGGSDDDASVTVPIDDEDSSEIDKAKGTSRVKTAAVRPTPFALRRGRCCICKEKAKEGITNHMKIHFPNGEYACPRCDTKFKVLGSLKLHLKRTCFDQQQVDPEEPEEEAQGLYKCDECDKAFRYKLSLDEHKRTHNQLYCEVCRKVLRDSETLARHKSSHTAFQCTLCEEKFRLFKPLARHYENVHKLTSRPFKCNHCPKTFSKLRYFIGHEWKHTGQLPFQCAQCPMKFKHDTDLVSHLRVHTKEKPFLCADCGKAFSCRSNLRRHLNFIHSETRNERRYSCSLCEKSFKEKGALRKHEKTKHRRELFRSPCLYCGKLFAPSAMGRHKLTHTGEKPFECKIPGCDKYFRSKTEVKRHIMQYHTGERPFTCNICGKGFIRSCLLATHMRTHSGEKPFVCPICGKAFPQQYSMNRHKKLMHSFEAE